MRTGLESANLIKPEAKPRTRNLVQSELDDLKHMSRDISYEYSKSLLKGRGINFDPVLDQYTSPGIQYYHVCKIKQHGSVVNY